MFQRKELPVWHYKFKIDCENIVILHVNNSIYRIPTATQAHTLLAGVVSYPYRLVEWIAVVK